MYEYIKETREQAQQLNADLSDLVEMFDRVDLPRRYNRTYGGKTRVAHVNKRAVSASVREIIKRVRRLTPDKVTTLPMLSSTLNVQQPKRSTTSVPVSATPTPRLTVPTQTTST